MLPRPPWQHHHDSVQLSFPIESRVSLRGQKSRHKALYGNGLDTTRGPLHFELSCPLLETPVLDEPSFTSLSTKTIWSL